MKRIAILLITLAIAGGLAFGTTSPPVVAHKPVTKQAVVDRLEDISVTVDANGSYGSGILFSRNGQVFVHTVGHLMESLQTPHGYADARIFKNVYRGTRYVGSYSLLCEVLHVSPPNRHDLALLRVRKQQHILCPAVKFNPTTPRLSTPVWHIGSFLGKTGACSLTSGIVSQYRTVGQISFIQISAISYPGASGGGVFTENGDCLGIVSRGLGPGFVLFIPAARIVSYYTEKKMAWAVDRKVPLPADFTKVPHDDPGPPLLDEPTSQSCGQLMRY